MKIQEFPIGNDKVYEPILGYSINETYIEQHHPPIHANDTIMKKCSNNRHKGHPEGHVALAKMWQEMQVDTHALCGVRYQMHFGTWCWHPLIDLMLIVVIG